MGKVPSYWKMSLTFTEMKTFLQIRYGGWVRLVKTWPTNLYKSNYVLKRWYLVHSEGLPRVTPLPSRGVTKTRGWGVGVEVKRSLKFWDWKFPCPWTKTETIGLGPCPRKLCQDTVRTPSLPCRVVWEATPVNLSLQCGEPKCFTGSVNGRDTGIRSTHTGTRGQKVIFHSYLYYGGVSSLS